MCSTRYRQSRIAGNVSVMRGSPAPGARINITADEQYVDDKNLGHAVSPHEECGVEAAVQLIEQHGGEATVMSMGGAESEEQLRAAISVGIQKMVLVPTDGSPMDPQQTAAALTQAITELEEADGAFDLIIFGNESADQGGFQVGIRIAHALGRPMVNGIKGLELPEGQEKFLEINAELSQEWPVITEMKDPPPDADDWRDVKDKLKYLER